MPHNRLLAASRYHLLRRSADELRMTEPDSGGCPCCDFANGVTRVACASPKVEAWSCAACGGQWWISVVNPRPQPFLDRLTGTVELAAARSVLRAVITLADEAPGISDEELRSRLLILAQRAERRS